MFNYSLYLFFVCTPNEFFIEYMLSYVVAKSCTLVTKNVHCSPFLSISHLCVLGFLHTGTEVECKTDHGCLGAFSTASPGYCSIFRVFCKCIRVYQISCSININYQPAYSILHVLMNVLCLK